MHRFGNEVAFHIVVYMLLVSFGDPCKKKMKLIINKSPKTNGDFAIQYVAIWLYRDMKFLIIGNSESTITLGPSNL